MNACVAALIGCTGVGVTAPAGGKPLQLSGRVHGGQQAVAASVIQIYAVGTGGDGAAATPLLAIPAITDSAGNFNIAGEYTCPDSNPDVYLVATGGNPGLEGAATNTDLAMMAALGPCRQAAQQFVLMNELTTVGSLAALFPYATGYGAISSGAGDAGQLSAAFGVVNEYTNIASGTVPGPALPSGYYASSVAVDTLADVLAACVNSAGGVAGDHSACGNLFHLATPPSGVVPTDTISALINILKNPTQNVTEILNLVPATGAPFEPVLSQAPAAWTLPIVEVPAPPAFSLGTGTYAGTQIVTLTDSAPGASVYYTTDGSTPTTASTLYSGAIAVPATETVNAIASVSGVSSGVASATYTITSPPPPVTSQTPSSSGSPHSVATFGAYEFVSVQGSGQIFTYSLASGSLVQVGAPYRMPCSDPSGMVVPTIGGVDVMAVVCYDTGSLVTLRVGNDGSLSALGSVSGLAAPYFGIALDGTNVYVPLFGTGGVANGSVAQVSLATPSAPVVTATVSLASPGPGEYATASYLTVANGFIYVAAGSESAPQASSSTIQVVNESTMTLVGTPFVVPHSPQGLAVAGSVLFVTSYDAQQLQSIDVSTPTQLQTLDVLSFAAQGCAAIPVQVVGTKAYVGCYPESTVQVVDVSQPAAMSLVKTIGNIETPEGMGLADGKFVLVAAGSTGGSVYSLDTTQ